MYLSDQLEARGLLSYKPISLTAKMVFNLLFVLNDDFCLLYLFCLRKNSWVFIWGYSHICLRRGITKLKKEKEKGERVKSCLHL